jgi:hypothetical protein
MVTETRKEFLRQELNKYYLRVTLSVYYVYDVQYQATVSTGYTRWGFSLTRSIQRIVVLHQEDINQPPSSVRAGRCRLQQVFAARIVLENQQKH